ncbi:MAG: hypothetical protein IMF06_08685 [Proteobacteria bacterium]|nr:hypothetical protein [Pseudomonadota bacterium]
MFTNKHVIIALIVGPILAILAWLAVGQIAGEKAAVAVPGQSYPLVEKSDCRYESGHCKLENEDFKLVLTLEQRGIDSVLVLKSVHALEGVLVSVAGVGGETAPSAMRPGSGDKLEWMFILDEVPASGQRIHLVASSGGTQYFGDASTAFIKRSQ